MTSKLHHYSTFCLLPCLGIVLIALSGCRLLNSQHQGGSIVTTGETVSGSLPKQLPKLVYVADFTLDSANFTADQGVRGALPGGLLQNRGENLPKPLADNNPAAAAQAIVETMAKAITSKLKAKGIPAQRLEAGPMPLPAQGWMISGVFTDVDQGNRLQRAVMGFGKGATQMEVQAGISDLGSANPTAPFALFGTDKEQSRMPGAVVTKNPYVAAAKFVMEKNASTRDVDHTADQIVNELLKFRNQIR